MVAVMYPAGKHKMLSSGLDNLTLMAQLLDADYAYNSAHVLLNAIPVGARISAPVALTNIVLDSGTLRLSADTVTFPTVGAGENVTHAVIYDDTGAENTSTLMIHANGDGAVNIATDGTDIIIRFNDGYILDFSG